MKIYFLFFCLFVFSNFSEARNKKSFYKEKYIYQVQYFNVNIGKIALSVTGKNKQESSFKMQLDTKKNWAWIYSLHQSIVAKFSKHFSQLTEWRYIKREKSVNTYEHMRLSPSLVQLKKMELTYFNKKKKIISKYFVLLQKNKVIHSVWTVPWYIAFWSRKEQKNKTIRLLYKKKLVAAKINVLNRENSLVLKEKVKAQVFSVSSAKDKSISLKVWVSQYKKNSIVSSFNLKLKTGQLKASLKSYKKERL